MKRIFFLIIAVFSAVATNAQDYKLAPVGDQLNADGTRTYSVPQSTIYVQVTLQHEKVEAGIYAQYAKRYFGTDAAQVDFEDYKIVDVKISGEPFDNQSVTASIEPIASPAINFTEFPTGTMDIAAQKAAKVVYDLRKRRIELISGDIGEHIYGAGLQAALDEMTRLENSYLALFYGTQSVSNHVYNYSVVPVVTKPAYILCRFSADYGLEATDSANGEPITLTITPSGGSDTLYPAPDPKDKKAVYTTYQVADNSLISIKFEGKILATAIVPVFQFGVEVQIAQ